MVRPVNFAFRRFRRGAHPDNAVLPDRYCTSGFWQYCSPAEAPGRRRRQAGHGSSLRKCPRRRLAVQPSHARHCSAWHRRGGRRRRDGLVPQPRPAGEPVFSQENRPRCRRGAGDGALPACSRRAGSRLTVALLHLSLPPRYRLGSAEALQPRAELPPRSLRRRSRGTGTRTRPPALGSSVSPLVASQTPHLTARRARHRPPQPPRPELPPRTSPHPISLTARHDRGSPPADPPEPGSAWTSHPCGELCLP